MAAAAAAAAEEEEEEEKTVRTPAAEAVVRAAVVEKTVAAVVRDDGTRTRTRKGNEVVVVVASLDLEQEKLPYFEGTERAGGSSDASHGTWEAQYVTNSKVSPLHLRGDFDGPAGFHVGFNF